ncbi:AcrB family membrane transport protein [Plesiocystis pacifica SIR-1]|uniref:AcrB family membrane transport protein n=1 Tax=Plesiocystis pacifica SIR-1 TaxID=391625 RepID=A6G7K2_9BACT|nr:efflux RND transporter permease subunit [Plesiocystis pacifica]EDM78211.1 AcrB family membrane transport protein [Plesiocystis pacifica SIR-1]
MADPAQSGEAPREHQVHDNAVVHLALRRPITMLMIFASVLVLGMVAFLNIPLELIPAGASAPFLSVEVPYGNATAQDVEDKITRPLEAELATTPTLDEISATSSSSRARVNMLFEQDADMDLAYREVRDRVARVRADLPDDVQQIAIQKQDADSLPIAFYGVSWPEGYDGAMDIVERRLIRRLERIEGVGLVANWGGMEREIRIEVDRELAEAANLNIFEIAQSLGQSHFNLASGTLEEAEGKYLLRSLAEYSTPEELEEVVVGPNDLRLADVADVLYEYPERESYARYKGRESMAVFVIKESEANTVDVCDRVKAEIAEAVKDPALGAFEVTEIFIQGDTIVSSLEQVVDSGLQGGILAVFVLLFFLRRLRLTVVIALSIPLSMFMALPFMYFAGQSINLVSLIGLMICIGLVVDNSVVVAENIARYRARGVSRFAAALHGASEVALPITLATATTMVVFLPAALISSGSTQFFMIRMVTPVCVSLLASLFVALILIPLAAAFLLDRDLFEDVDEHSWRGRLMRADKWWKDKLGRLYDMTFGRLAELYGRLLRLSLRRRVDVVLISLLAMGSLVIPADPETGVSQSGEGNMGGRQVNIGYSMPQDVTLEEADAFTRELEAHIAEHRDEWGVDGEFVQVEPGWIELQIFFGPPQDGDRPYREVGEEIVSGLPTPPGWQKYSRFAEADGGQKSSFPVFIYGDSHRAVQEVKEELEASLEKVEGVTSILSSNSKNSDRQDELALSLDPVMAERLGVSAGMVGNTVAYALRGNPLPRFTGDGREIEVWIRYKKEDREKLSDLLEFKVPTSAGTAVPLRTVTQREVRKGETVLVRNNKRVAAMVQVEIDPKRRAEAIANIQAFLGTYDLPPGVSFDSEQEARALNTAKRDLIWAAVLACVFIFLLMGFLFESFVLPLSVLPAIPLSLVGVWWFLYLTDSDLDVLAGIGLLLLIGVVVNNAIVLVDFINGARAQGVERSEAIVQAGVQRFRPIFMTALTTVGGMLPLAFADPPAEGIPYGPFGKTLVGGMTTSTILTLIVVPVSYTAFDDLRERMLAWFARVFRRDQAGADGPAEGAGLDAEAGDPTAAE